MKSNKSIICDVHSCKYCNCDDGYCCLDEVKISCSCDNDKCNCKEVTICKSFKEDKSKTKK